MSDDAAPFVAKGKTAFCKFVLDCDPEIRALEEVLLVDKGDNLLATGQALLCAAEMKAFKKGTAVSVRPASGQGRGPRKRVIIRIVFAL